MRDGSKKLAAFSPLSFENLAWIVVVDAPLDEVSKFLRQQLIETLLLIGIIGVVFAGAFLYTYRNNLVRIHAEEEAKQWRTKRELEEKIRASEEQYRRLVEISPDAIAVHCQGKITFVNEAAVRLMGATTPEELIGKSVLEFVHPRDRETVKRRIMEVLEAGKPVPVIEEQFLRLDGSTIDVEVQAAATTYNGMRAVQVIARDITSRKKAEEGLQRLADQLKHLLEISQIMLSTLDIDQLIEKILQALRKVLKFDSCGLYLLDEKAGLLRPYALSDTEWISPNLSTWPIPLGRGIVSAVIQSGKGELVNNAQSDPRSVYPDGTSVQCEHLISIPIRSKDRILGVFNVSRKQDPPFDQEEFHLVELFLTHASIAIENARLFQEITESEAKYRTLFEESKDAVFISTPEGKFIDINPAGVELFGFSSKDELLSVNIARDLYKDPLKHEEFKRLIERMGYVKDLELELKRKDGRSLTVLETATAVRHSDGNILAYRGIIRDITAQRALEEQVRQAQKLESLGTLAAGIAHDFNNVLNIIIGYASLLDRGARSPELIKRSVKAITAAGMRGTDLVKQILTFARKSEITIETIHVNDVVKEIANMISETFPKTIEIYLNLAANLPLIEADATQIHQVLLNLCVNARDAMPSGGKLKISTSQVTGEYVQRKFRGASAREYVTVTVNDTGKGMDKKTLSRIFEPFFTTKERGKGTGMGLAVAYGIVQSHKGFIEVESEPGRGTTFFIYLPASEQSTISEIESGGLPQDDPGGSETILIVEDEEMLLNLVKTILEEKGYRVLTTQDGIEALELYKYRKKEINLVISDMGLPKLSGYDLYERLRTINPNVQMILASGFIEPAVKDLAFKRGVKEFIQKPYNPDDVLHVVRKVLNKE